MTLRRKTILMTCLVFAAAIALIFIVSQTILMRRFEELERENTTQNVQRATSALYENFDSVNINFSSFMVEKECFSVVQDGDEMYIKMIIDEPTYATLGVNYIIFAMAAGVTPIGMGFDLETHEPLGFPPGLLEELSGDSPLTAPPEGNDDDKGITGILLLENSTLLVQSYPIMISTNLGPISGRMIFARFIDSAEIEALAGQTHLSLLLYRLDDTGIPEDFETACTSLSLQSPIFVRPLDGNRVAGYGLLTDIYGDPALILRADMPRSIYQQGQETVIWLAASLTTLSLAFGLVTIVLLNRVLLSRISGLSLGVNRVRQTGDPSRRVTVKGTDELATLGMAINGMLATLERSQLELRESEAKKQALVDAIPDMIFRLNRNGELLDAREAKENKPRSLRLSSSGSAIQDQPLPSKLILYAKAYIEEALRTREPQVFEFQMNSNGSTSFYEARVAVSGEEEAVVMVRDVTERKQLDEARKKELLLKEIHHRVKNNLQVISSLLYLQSRRIQDRKVVEMFNESGNRVKSMTLIHQKLYQSKDMASVGFAEYVRDLTDALFISYGADPNLIRLTLNIDDGFVGIDTAIPCGLVINELVSNSLKYAFPDGRSGSIGITMYRTEDQVVRLVVSDDGIGLPEDVDHRKTETLGLQLVATLVEQLEGSIELNREKGTQFVITFRDPKQQNLEV